MDGDIIGRLLVIEFDETDSNVFDEVIAVLEKHRTFEKMQLSDMIVKVLPNLEIYPDQRKVYCNKQEVCLTTKEYDILYLLVSNKGRVLTYAQIYENVWGDSEYRNSVIRYHIYHLREKLYAAFSDIPFTIRCIREVGYCFEVNSI